MTLSPKDRFIAILKKNHHMVLATCENGIPWIAPLYFAYDDAYALYFVSRKDSRHVQNIKQNPKIAVSIFDSHATPETCDGIQMQALCTQLEDLTAIVNAAKVLYTRRFVDEKERLPYLSPGRFMNAMKMRLFKIEPQEIFVVDTSRPDDYRIKVEG